MTKQRFSWFESNSYYLIWINGIGISNDRNQYSDYASLYSSDWEGMLVGTDGYPKIENDLYYIGGGKDG